MFPSKKGLGVQLSHGINGPSNFLSQYNPEKPWVFARERDSGYGLKTVPNSSVRLSKAQLVGACKARDGGKDALYKAVMLEVPSDLLHSLENDPQDFSKCDAVYDPSIGRMLDFGYIKAAFKQKRVPIVAYTGGASGDYLVVQSVTDLKQDVMVNGEAISMELPTLKGGAMLQFECSIKQVETFKSDPVFKIPQKSIMVRTSLGCSIVDVKITKDGGISLIRAFDITAECLGEEIAHVVNNPFDSGTVGIIGVKGKWAIYRRTKARMVPFKEGCAFVPDELSSFKRISWGFNEDTLLLIGRSYVKLVNLRRDECQDIITCNGWSEMREYSRWRTSNRYGMLLTSRELIWVDVEGDLFKRVLSWKHCLNPDDPSLRMSLQSYDDVQYVFVHSEMTPLVVVFQFKLDNGFPKSIKDPFIYKVESHERIHDFVLQPLFEDEDDEDESADNGDSEPADDGDNEPDNEGHSNSTTAKPQGLWFALYKFSKDLELTRVILSSENTTVLNGITPPPMLKQAKETITKARSHEMGGWERKATIKRSRDSLPALFSDVEPVSENDEDDEQVFLKFANSFDIDKLRHSQPSSLRDGSELCGFSDLEEFDNMMEQLVEQCKLKGIQHVPLPQLFQCLVEDSNETNFKDIQSRMTAIWPQETICHEVTRDLALTLSIFHSEEHEDELANATYSTLDKETRELVAGWDSPDEEHEAEPVEEDEFVDHIPALSSQPAIVSSQAQAHSQFARSSLKRPGAFSQMSQSSQSTQKKQKKRKKGFA